MMAASARCIAMVLAVANSKSCSLEDDTSVAYSLAAGVGDASRVWVQDLLWWWKEADPTIKYQGLSAADLQNCDLAAHPNLRIFVNPGGNTYDQLSSLGASGRANILAFIQRSAPSAYVGFCAGGYLASTGYFWETIHEDASYFQKFGTAPPLGAFPYEVEGSIVDIGDDQFGDAHGIKYRVVNISNGQRMLYYGGSTFGWNQAPDVSKDPEVKILAYYTDFYGYHSYNLPAAWQYQNLLLTSVHPEADNCTTYDCPEEGSLPEENILQNRAWLVSHINSVAGTTFNVPSVPLPPSFDTTPPHQSYPELACYGAEQSPSIVFCDDFDAPAGQVPSGLWNWQRSQTEYTKPQPWNTTYTTENGLAADGNGYALASQKGTTRSKWASITTLPVSLAAGGMLSFKQRGQSFNAGGQFTVQFSQEGTTWTNLPTPPLSEAWEQQSIQLPAGASLQVRFNCGGSAECALDSVFISATEAALIV
jgi:glutamine amidotransferase-like uncharacterized protein